MVINSFTKLTEGQIKFIFEYSKDICDTTVFLFENKTDLNELELDKAPWSFDLVTLDFYDDNRYFLIKWDYTVGHKEFMMLIESIEEITLDVFLDFTAKKMKEEGRWLKV